ncbi:MAG: hypothetical protein EBU90_29955 [Proteobacteria bacterium]|nr:hypothetical protein [Pseudomonadota bacterium]
MAVIPASALYVEFGKGKTPSDSDFVDLIDSCYGNNAINYSVNTYVQENSGFGATVYSYVVANSSHADVVYTYMRDNSAFAATVYSYVVANSSHADEVYTYIRDNSAFATGVYSYVRDNSAAGASAFETVKSLSSNWNEGTNLNSVIHYLSTNTVTIFNSNILGSISASEIVSNSPVTSAIIADRDDLIGSGNNSILISFLSSVNVQTKTLSSPAINIVLSNLPTVSSAGIPKGTLYVETGLLKIAGY